MAKPDVEIELSNGNLGRVAPSEDGISGIIGTGVAVGGQFALGDVLGPFFSLQDAIDKGITAAYDTANTCMMHRHIKDFYDYTASGTELYVMVVAKTVTQTQMADNTLLYLQKMLETANGRIKLVAITRIPDALYVPVYLDQLETDTINAISKAQLLAVAEFAKHRPVRIIIEARNFQGNASSLKNLRDVATGPLANRVGVVIGADNAVALAEAHMLKHAFAGKVLGTLAKNAVQRNIGRVKNGKLLLEDAGLSNGAAYSTLTDANIVSLHDKGYIFALKHTGKAGFFFNDDPAACPITDDFSSLSRGRVIDKAARITRAVYLEELNDDVELHPDTGKLSPATIKQYQGQVENQINLEMTSKKEISRVTAFVDPDQNILSTDEVLTELNILPKGNAKKIKATLAYENPLA